MTISVSDPYNLVPELFEAYTEFVKDESAQVDVLLVTSSESWIPSKKPTVLIDPEPNMHWWQQVFSEQFLARPNSLFAVSGYYLDRRDETTVVPCTPFWFNGTLTLQNNPSLDSIYYSVPKPFVANALLGGWSIPRGAMIHRMQQLGLLDSCIVNYFDRSTVSDHDSAERKQTYPEYFFNYRSKILDEIDHDIFKSRAFPVNDKINTCSPIPNTKPGRPVWISQLIAEQIYQQTYLSIVAETESDDSVFFISEKIVKPMLVGHPFVVYGCKGYLNELRNLGFKTFDTWIDESYDLIDDSTARASAIIDSVYKFALQPEDKKIQMLIEMQTVLKHNQQLMSDSKWLTKSIADWIRSAV